ncbi:hypothetical protein HanRHA438_Chr14g0654411 [Helianthus annuus]|nr:hypothetical protein HanRHA438_Chr14g0654411 [Helianthus annuus]
MATKTYVRQNSHNRSISSPCGPVCEAEYKKLMGQDDEPSSPTSDIVEEDIMDQNPPTSRRGLVLFVTSLVLIFIAIAMSKYSKDGFWLTTKKIILWRQ